MINVLDSNTINKIAAGEVIERPSSIVKELLENSIDAKATKITIEIRNGGKSFIKIIDNGVGIPKDEIKKAFLSHATSKIHDIDDLQSLITFGFRGEALPSISSVSKLTIETKTVDSNVGYKYCIKYGEAGEITETAMNDGTIITVEDMFENVPVRKNFLASEQSEAAKIFDIIEKEALANPSISFRFIQDGKEKIHTSGDNSLKNIIYTIYGKDCTNSMIDVKHDGDVNIRGYIGDTDFVRSNRNDEIYFVNNRFVKNSMITKAIEEAYKPFLMQHKFPFTVLFIDISPDKVDVNVHPSKAEVRFANNNHIFGQVYNAIINTLQSKFQNHSVDNDSFKATNQLKDDFSSVTNASSNFINENRFFLNKEDKNENDNTEIGKKYKQENFLNKSSIFEKNNDNEKKFLNNNLDKVSLNQYENTKYLNETELESNEYSNANTPKEISLSPTDYCERKKNHRIIGQLFDTYVLIEADNSLYILDQHAAHEKIYFEKFMKNIKNDFNNGLISQKVFPEIIISLNPIQLDLVNRYEEVLEKLGFVIDVFGTNDVKISAVPIDIPNISKKELLLELIDSLSDLNAVTDVNIITEKIASMSCKKAVKANHKLSMVELERLIDDLFTLDNPFNCPHGRPTMIKITHAELDKKFKRIL